MENYSLSAKAQFDVVGIYKYGIKYFGLNQAVDYLSQLENFLDELAVRPELARDASPIAKGLKYYNFKSHVIYYSFDNDNEIYVLRILGKRMNFMKHL
ncbi:type II toxin-antitoxin system RelE/ParE family toxin [Aureibaculum luteum]|uniref:type II toxin-antitoxin system RelE/ParE family toxin n=1 Tax=Aureibaculum luteum TaxID=1548456 RepID=UPI000E49FD7F|nr:type II toxin-antitoxin system RelE/ParE family toxin [Aureibaculum luteum]